MIKTNSKIDNYLKQKLADNDIEITFKELENIGIKHNEIDLDINENTYLSRIYMFKSYKICLKDKRRNFDNKTLDEYAEKNEILKVLSNYKLTEAKYIQFKKNKQAEVEWNKDLEKYLKTHFLNVKRGNPTESIEIDVDLGQGQAGLELKWADKINKNNPMNAVIGQIDGYFRNGNYKELFLVVAGYKDLSQDSFILQLEKRVKSSYGCNFIFIEII